MLTVVHPLPHERLERRYVNRLHTRVGLQKPHHRQLSGDSLAGAGGGTDQNVTVGVIDRMEDCQVPRGNARAARRDPAARHFQRAWHRGAWGREEEASPSLIPPRQQGKYAQQLRGEQQAWREADLASGRG